MNRLHSRPNIIELPVLGRKLASVQGSVGIFVSELWAFLVGKTCARNLMQVFCI